MPDAHGRSAGRWTRGILATGLGLLVAAIVGAVPPFISVGLGVGYLVAGGFAFRAVRDGRVPSARRLTVISAITVPATPAVFGAVTALQGPPPMAVDVPLRGALVAFAYGALFYPVVAAFAAGVEPASVVEPFAAAMLLATAGLAAMIVAFQPRADLAASLAVSGMIFYLALLMVISYPLYRLGLAVGGASEPVRDGAPATA